MTFRILVVVVTRYPSIRHLFHSHKDIRKSSQTDPSFQKLWMRQNQSCGAEWDFYRNLAIYCISKSELTDLVENERPSNLGRLELVDGDLSSVPIESLLSWCRSAPDFTFLDTLTYYTKDLGPSLIPLGSVPFYILQGFLN